jgi:hypothetical protein
VGVVGIGGFFFRADDPDGLRAWYAENLGVGTGEHGVWQTAAGPSVFTPFPADGDDFATERQWMLNLRVDGLDAVVAALTTAGIEVTTNPDWTCPASVASPASAIPRATRSSSGNQMMKATPDSRLLTPDEIDFAVCRFDCAPKAS